MKNAVLLCLCIVSTFAVRADEAKKALPSNSRRESAQTIFVGMMSGLTRLRACLKTFASYDSFKRMAKGNAPNKSPDTSANLSIKAGFVRAKPR